MNKLSNCKKVVYPLLIALLILVCIAAASCNSSHEHSYAWSVTRKATCSEPSLSVGRCKCGHTTKQEGEDLIPHTFSEWAQTSPATCTTQATETRTCGACGEVEQRFVGETVAHTFRTWTVVREASCTEVGIEERTCACGATEQRETDKGPHNFGNWSISISPTCTKFGAKTRTCACGETEALEIPKIDHAYADWITLKAATCTETGTKTGTCACGKTETAEIPLIDHTYTGWTTVKEISCTENGEEIGYCVCGKSKTNVLKTPGHEVIIEPMVNPTETQTGLTQGSYCGECGERLAEQEIIGKISVQDVDVISGITYEGYADGNLKFFWQVHQGFQNDLISMRVKVSAAGVNETHDVWAENGSWQYKMSASDVTTYSFSFTPITRDLKQGNAAAKNVFYLPDALELNFPRLEVTTKEGELPTFTKVSAPSGYWGQGITDANYVKSIVNLYDADNSLLYTTEKNGFDGAKIKVRGNTSAYASKTPFKIKLAEKYDMLGAFVDREDGVDYANKNWVLLSAGGTQNVAVGSTVSAVVENGWTPAYTYVTLFVNGEFRGLYVLIESVEPDESRCNVSDTGYIIEMDAYWWNEGLYFTTPISEKRATKFTFKAPDSELITADSPEYKYIKEYVSDFERILLGQAEGNISDYIDVRSFARWLLTHDILATSDSGGANMYIMKYDMTDASKLTMDLVWDYDTIYFGNKYNATEFAQIHSAPFFYIFYLWNNTEFREIYAEEYARVRDEILPAVRNTLSQFENETYEKLFEYENLRWKGSTTIEPVSVSNPKAISFFEDHLSWMDEAIAQ